MNIYDIILAVILLVFFFNGFRKGLVESLVHLAGLIVVIILIAKTGTILKISLMSKFGFGETISVILSYLLIFIVVMILAKLAIITIQKVINFLSLTALDRILGGIFGILTGMLVLSVLLIILEIFPFRDTIRQSTRDSRIVRVSRSMIDKIIVNYPRIDKGKDQIEEFLRKNEEH